MGGQSSYEKIIQYSIDLNIDKNQYAIQDQIKGYVRYYANPFLYKNYNKSYQNWNLELRLQFEGYYEQHAWESVSEDQYNFVLKDEIVKNCFFSDNETMIEEKLAFVYNLDLITSSGYEATIQHKDSIFEKQQINFLIYRPYINIERPISKANQFPLKSMICCNFGQISIKVTLNKTDLLINDIANLIIECDSSLSSRNIENFQYDLIGKQQYSINKIDEWIYNTIEREGQQDKLFKFIQQIPITSISKYESSFHSSLETPNFSIQYYIQITCNTGYVTNQIKIQIPIILYQSQEQNLKDYRDRISNQSFNQNQYEEYKCIKFVGFEIKQEQWMWQTIDFPKKNNKQSQFQHQEENNNLILYNKSQNEKLQFKYHNLQIKILKLKKSYNFNLYNDSSNQGQVIKYFTCQFQKILIQKLITFYKVTLIILKFINKSSLSDQLSQYNTMNNYLRIYKKCLFKKHACEYYYQQRRNYKIYLIILFIYYWLQILPFRIQNPTKEKVYNSLIKLKECKQIISSRYSIKFYNCKLFINNTNYFYFKMRHSTHLTFNLKILYKTNILIKMGAESSNEKQYSIDLKIDKQQYAIKDQIKGYVIFYANPFLYQEYNESFVNYNLELKLELVGYYEQSAWESISQNYNQFIIREDLIKNCIYGSERKINEKVAFTYDLDLITSSDMNQVISKQTTLQELQCNISI